MFAQLTNFHSDFTRVEQCYREQIVKRYNKIHLTGLPHSNLNLHEIALEQIFIKLNIELLQTEDWEIHHINSKYHPSGKPSLPSAHARRATHINFTSEELHKLASNKQPELVTLSLIEALRRYPHLLIIGGPGSGKTTMVSWLAILFARRKQAKIENDKSLTEDRLPIILELRKFASQLKSFSQQPSIPDFATMIANFINQDAYYLGTSATFIQQALERGRCAILLDGLDEIVDLEIRKTLNAAIQAFLQNPIRRYSNNLILLSSRPHGYNNINLSAFQKCEVKPFSIDDVASFIQHWYAATCGDSWQTKATDLTHAIEADERVSELAVNPLLCTIIAIVYHNYQELPTRRVKLYLKCCEILLHSWEYDKAIPGSGLIEDLDWQTWLNLLTPVAYWIHNQEDRLAASEKDVAMQLAIVLRKQQIGDPVYAEKTARRFIEVIRDRSGLLQGRGDGTVEFTHRTFQEYLAARHIADQGYPDCIDWVMVHLHKVWWREVHLLVIGCLGSSRETAPQASTLLNAMLDFYRPPWRMLRPLLIAPLFSRWGRKSLSVKEEWGSYSIEWSYSVSGVGHLVIPIHFLGTSLMTSLGRWQWQRRLAWIQGRELTLALRASMECDPAVISPKVITRLQNWANYFLLRTFYATKIKSSLLDEFIELFDSWHHDWLKTQVDVSLINELSEILWDFEHPLSAKAARTLVQIRHSPSEISSALILARDHRRWDVCSSIIKAQESLSNVSAEVITAILDIFDSLHEMVLFQAVAALSAIGQTSPRVIAALYNSLIHNSTRVGQVSAARALTIIGQTDPQVKSTLLNILNSSDRSVRLAILDSLVNFDQVSPAFNQVSPAVVTTLFNIALYDSDSMARSEAIYVLKILSQALPEITEILLEAIKHLESDVRAAAADALGVLGIDTPVVINALLCALRDPESSVRVSAAYALAEIDQSTPAIINSLLDALRDSESDVRAAAARALGVLGQAFPEVIDSLLDALQDSGGFVRNNAVEALGELGHATSTVIDALISTLYSPNRYRSSDAVDALGKLGQTTPEVIDALLDVLDDPEQQHHVRGKAVLVLGELGQGSPEVIDTLLYYLQYSQSSLCVDAGKALHMLGQTTPDFIDGLLSFLRSPYEYRRREIIDILREINQVSPRVISTLLYTIKNASTPYELDAAILALSNLGIEEKRLLRSVLIALIKDLDDLNGSSLEASRRLIEGRPLPEYKWITIRERQERQRRIKWYLWWIGSVCIVLLAAFSTSYLLTKLGTDNLFVQLGAAIVAFIGLIAAVAQVLGWTLHNPYERDSR